LLRNVRDRTASLLEQHKMTKQKLITLFVISLAVGSAQCWALSYFLGVNVADRWSVIVPASFLCIIIGWPMIAFYVMAPVSNRTRWRGLMRSFISIFGGMAGLSAVVRSSTWASISLVGVFVTVLLSFVPFRSNNVWSKHEGT
jgi:hypothetical protein